MSYLSDFGFAGWAASMGILLPGIPHQCDPDGIHHPPGTGGSTSIAGAAGSAAGATPMAGAAGATAGSAGALTIGGTGATGGASAGGSAAGGQCSVSTTSICGNGCIEPGEECDDGTNNGPAGPCEADCFLTCDGCPIRVDPAATANGSGRDWQHPAKQIQSAIDRQAARGGGEVWVIGGDFNLAAVDGQPGFTIPSGVTLKGGFAVNGASNVTRLHGSRNAPLLTIASATAVLVEDLSLADGDPPFVIQASHGVTLQNVIVEPHGEYTNYGARVDSSEVRFEQCTLSLPATGFSLVMTGSDVTLSNSSVDATGIDTLSPKLSADSSRLLVQASRVDRGLIVGEGSQALLLDSTFLNTYAPGAALVVNGRAAAMGTEFGMGYGDASVHVNGSAMIFDSSFTGYATATRGGYPVAWAIVGAGSLTVSLSSFLGGACSYPRNTPCPAIESGSIDNSFFVYDESAGPAYVGSNYDPQTLITLDGVMQPSNCTVAASRSSYGNGRIAGPYPCVDQGDATRLRASQTQLLETYVAPFRTAPFNADLGRYVSDDFWRSEAVVSSACGDENAPDPGRHFRCTQ